MKATAIKSNGKDPFQEITEQRNEATLKLRRLAKARLEVEIVGLTSVIPHRWSEKSLLMMRDKQTGSKVKSVKEPKKPEAEAEASLYRLPDGRPGMPATAFKSALTGASRFFDGVTMVMLTQLLFVEGEGPEHLVPITGTLHMREDTPRLATGVVDLRYRYEIRDWSAVLVVRFVPSLIDSESIIALADAAGMGGVGDWRPSSPKSLTGVYGTWAVKEKEVDDD